MEQTFGHRKDLAGERHLGFESFAANIDVLRESGVVDSETRVIAAHLSHHNPGDLAQRMKKMGVEVVSDSAWLRGVGY